jgi:hypothetical protein
MIRKISFVLFSLALLLFLSSCYYNNKETLYPNLAPCDSSVVTYSKNISSIMSSYCINCHGADAASLGGSIDFRTYEGVKAKIDRIYGCMNHSSGYSPMPKGGNKLDDCKIQQVKKWKDTGAQNN